MTDFDVIVVGAGPAGSVAARFAAERGARVLLLDRKDEPGVPVQCGELLPSVGTLREMFPRAPGLDGLVEVPRRCISLDLAGLSLFSPARREYDLPFEGHSLWRARFDRHLACLAQQAGADVRTGVTVRGLAMEGGNARAVETDDETVSASAVIGADGPLSRVRRSAGLEAPTLHPCVQYTIPGDYGNTVELHFPEMLPGGHVWLVPRSNGANIGLETGGRRSLKPMLDQFVWRLGIEDRPKIETGGLLPVSGPARATVRGNILLCGDAAGQVMAFNGWGVATSMVCGRAAGETAAAAVAGKASFQDYEKRWRAEVGDQLAGSAWVRRRMDRLAMTGLTMELAFAFLRRWGIRRILGGKRLV